ncbi:MAG: membrane-bound serine protease (ClpP class) [Chitinophagales bacterium]|jgi:membrane-bound serine protease (ClpP class)
MKYPLYLVLTYILMSMVSGYAQNSDSVFIEENIEIEEEVSNGMSNKVVYLFEIHDEIGPGATRITQSAISAAIEQKADYLVLDLNTYGGLVTDADSIRTKLMQCPIPAIVFIRNNAASAGALISIACDSIYMQTGSTIGAAAVVREDGSYAEEKYQSYMRNKMRATAEATDRDPDIAEGMVNPNVVIEGVTKEGEIITFTVEDALKNGYCNAKTESLKEVYEAMNLDNPTVIKHKISTTEKLIQFLVKPAVSGVLLLVLLGGIYFELQTPGVGFPLAASAIAAILYFAPQYLEGFAANWEIILFIVGLGLIMAEVFLIPGFGVAGIAGIGAVMVSLALALLKNIDGFDFTFVPASEIGGAFLMVSSIMVIGIIMLILASKNIAESGLFKRFALSTEQNKEDGFVISASSEKSLEGKEGLVTADLRPAGKIEIDDEQYDAQSDGEYLLVGTKVKVKKQQGAYLIVNQLRS